jgi:hypothetical protein
MSVDKLNPQLLKVEGASEGDVLTYVSANSRVEFKAASGGGGSGITTGKAIAMAIVFG